MEKIISKSKFKLNALAYFREIEKTGQALIISDRGKPVLKIVPYSLNADDSLNALRETVSKYENPLEPLNPKDWDAL